MSLPSARLIDTMPTGIYRIKGTGTFRWRIYEQGKRIYSPHTYQTLEEAMEAQMHYRAYLRRTAYTRIIARNQKRRDNRRAWHEEMQGSAGS
jgi:hypothetical protein